MNIKKMTKYISTLKTNMSSFEFRSGKLMKQEIIFQKK